MFNRIGIGKRHILPAGVAMLLSLIVVPIFLSRSAPIKVLSFHLLEQKVVQGDKLRLTYSYRVLKSCGHSTLYISIYDQTERIRMYEGELSSSVDVPEDFGPDIYSGMTKYVSIPDYSDVGTGSLQAYIEFKCNFIHQWWPIILELNQQDFNIVKKVTLNQAQEQKQLQEWSVPLPTDQVVPTPQLNGNDSDSDIGNDAVKIPLPVKKPYLPIRASKINTKIKIKHASISTSKEMPFDIAPPTPSKRPVLNQGEDWPDWFKSLFMNRS